MRSGVICVLVAMMASVFLCGTMYRKNRILMNKVSNLEGQMERWESLVLVLQEEIDLLKRNGKDVDARITGMDDRIDGMDSRIQSVGESVEGVMDAAKALESRVQELDTAFDGLDTRVQSVEVSVEVVDTAIQAVSNRVQELNSTVSAVVEDLVSVQGIETRVDVLDAATGFFSKLKFCVLWVWGGSLVGFVVLLMAFHLLFVFCLLMRLKTRFRVSQRLKIAFMSLVVVREFWTLWIRNWSFKLAKFHPDRNALEDSINATTDVKNSSEFWAGLLMLIQFGSSPIGSQSANQSLWRKIWSKLLSDVIKASFPQERDLFTFVGEVGNQASSRPAPVSQREVSLEELDFVEVSHS